MCKDHLGILHIEASQSCLCIVDVVCGGGAGPKRGAHCNACNSWMSWASMFLDMGGAQFMSSAFWCIGAMCQSPARIVHIEASQSCLCIVGMVCEARGADQNGEHIAMHTILGCLGLPWF